MINAFLVAILAHRALGVPTYESSSTTTSTSTSSSTTSTSTSTSTSCPSSPSPYPAFNQTLFQSLLLAPTAAERENLLSDADTVFSFSDPCRTFGVVKGDGGRTVRADRATFPALVGQGGSITVGFLDGCGFNTPHVHPRAAQMNIVVQGRLFGSVTAENGVAHRNHTMELFDMTVFPAGALHTEFNPDCTPAVFVAAFPSEDPGVGQIAQEYFGLEDEIVAASAGGEVTVNGQDIDKFRALIPANVAKGVESCLKKCGLEKR